MRNDIKNLTLSAMFLALAFVMPFCMAFELATYGFVAGYLHGRLPKKKGNVYLSLLCAMVIGRVVWGLVMLGCLGFDVSQFGLSAFLAGAVLNSVPGIVLQIVLVPVLVITLEKLVKQNS